MPNIDDTLSRYIIDIDLWKIMNNIAGDRKGTKEEIIARREVERMFNLVNNDGSWEDFIAKTYKDSVNLSNNYIDLKKQFGDQKQFYERKISSLRGKNNFLKDTLSKYGYNFFEDKNNKNRDIEKLRKKYSNVGFESRTEKRFSTYPNESLNNSNMEDLVNKKRNLINEYFVLEKEYNNIFRRNKTDKFWKLSGKEGIEAIEIEDRQDDIYDEINELTNKIGVFKHFYPERLKSKDVVIERTKSRFEQEEKLSSNIEDRVKESKTEIEEPEDLVSKVESEEYTPKRVAKEPMGYSDTCYKLKHAIKEGLETKVIKGYCSRIKDYSNTLEESSILKKCAEILSGDYIKENGRRAWTWKQREEEVRNLYGSYKDHYTNIEKEKVEGIIKIVNSNKYARRVRKKELKRIYSIIKKPKETRFRRLLRKIKYYAKNCNNERGGKYA